MNFNAGTKHEQKFFRCVERAGWTKNKNKLFVSETPVFGTFHCPV